MPQYLSDSSPKFSVGEDIRLQVISSSSESESESLSEVEFRLFLTPDPWTHQSASVVKTRSAEVHRTYYAYLAVLFYHVRVPPLNVHRRASGSEFCPGVRLRDSTHHKTFKQVPLETRPQESRTNGVFYTAQRSIAGSRAVPSVRTSTKVKKNKPKLCGRTPSSLHGTFVNHNVPRLCPCKLLAIEIPIKSGFAKCMISRDEDDGPEPPRTSLLLRAGDA
ncbi:hypothetical protein BDR07DRAFT_1378655 [Suillus spraguei]|nr:hypothetical protein BDR07DRAFT_1378655 [Suillus spraguei]